MKYKREIYSRICMIANTRPGMRQIDIARELKEQRCTIYRALAYDDARLMEKQMIWPADYHPQTVSDYLVFGMELSPLTQPPIALPDDSMCALTGIPISFGYPASKIVPNAAGEFLDLLPGGVGGYLSENTARAFKGTWNLGSRVVFEDGTHYHPLIARDPRGERPCWSDLVWELWPAHQNEGMLMILVTDVKKRVWHRARIGVLGETTPVFIYDVTGSGLAGVQAINWPVLLEVLTVVENVYTMGFSKRGIRDSLLREWSRAQALGIHQAMRLENRLRPLRATPEFAMAVIIAQKKESENENPT
jgi:hypothetical protein